MNMYGERVPFNLWKSTGIVIVCVGVVLVMWMLYTSFVHAEESDDRYTNPISSNFADAYADPSIIRAHDGYWYAYATTTVMRKDNPGSGHDANYFMPISRSEDLTNWEYVGDVFHEGNHPEWAPFDGGTYYWAPDIHYQDGTYYLYYSHVYYGEEGFDRYQIGVATAPAPGGPWTDAGKPVIESSEGTLTIDPAHFVDEDGTRYLYYGSFNDNGIVVTELSDDGTEAVGEPTQVVRGHTGEAPYVVKRNDYYYLFYSDRGCCANTLSSYPIFVGRSTSPMGPFVDREGVSLMDSRVGGTIVNAPNGNKWIGVGHNAIVTDYAGQDWVVFNGIDRTDPEYAGYRPMLMDRLDWIDGWPTVRAGAWASEAPERVPTTQWDVGSDFNNTDHLDDDWTRQGTARSGWRLVDDADGQEYVRQQAPSAQNSFLVSSEEVTGNIRAQADVRIMANPSGRGSVGLVIAYQDEDHYIASRLEPAENVLVTEVIQGGQRVDEQRSPLPEGLSVDSWNNIVMEMRETKLEVTVTHTQLREPLAAHTLELAGDVHQEGSIGIVSQSARSEINNVGATSLYTPVTEHIQEPSLGTIDSDYSDEFDGSGELDAAWSWIRTPVGEQDNGTYRWPSQAGELHENGASVLLRDAPQGDYTIETKLSFPLGVDSNLNYRQAGIVAYDNDNRSVRLITMAFEDARHIKFAKEDNGAGNMRVGPAADEMWLRLQHRLDPETGEHQFRAASSRNGDDWIWGGVWTLPADTDPRIGLLSMGGEGTAAEFDYFRVYR